jgi:UDP-N-acetylglucosamine 2-epimerase (non-hydrolysing)
MIDSLLYALPKALKSDILTNLDLKSKEYVLMTLHRPSNVDDKEQLEDLLKIFVELSTNRKVVFPVHPRTNKNIDNHNLRNIIEGNKNIILIDPLGYIDFLALMNSADFIMTDSGGIQEETTVLGVPCLTLRTTTERPSTIDLGTNILIQPHPSNIRTAIDDMLKKPRKKGQIPPLWDGKASDRIAQIITDLLSRSPIVN